MKLFYFLFFVTIVLFSCNSKEKLQNNSIIVKDSIFTLSQSLPEQLRKQKVENFPIVFATSILDSLQQEEGYMENVYKLKAEIWDSIRSNKGVTYKKDGKLILSNNSDIKDYYNFLFYADSLYGRKCCIQSKEIVYKRLPTLNDSIEAFTTISFFADESGHDRGLIFNMVTFNTLTEKEIDIKTFSCMGIGYDNTEYYEAFEIKENTIRVKGYNYIEPEFAILNKKFVISKKGVISLEDYSINIIDYE